MFVKAGETVQVYLYPALTNFAQVNPEGNREVLPARPPASAWATLSAL